MILGCAAHQPAGRLYCCCRDLKPCSLGHSAKRRRALEIVTPLGQMAGILAGVVPPPRPRRTHPPWRTLWARCKGGGALKSETTRVAEFGSPQETFGMACLVQGNEGCFGRIRGGQHFIKTTLGEANTLTVRQAAASRSNCLSAAFAPPKKNRSARRAVA